MDKYLLLRFAHVIGLMLISAGLIGVFAADMRSRQVRDVKLFAQAVTFIAVFYDGLVVPGAIILLASGTWLIVEYHGGWEFIGTPWLAGMVLLFAFEFIEGNTITRRYFTRLRRLTRVAVAEGRVTPELARARGEQLASFTHFLDIPLLLVIVSLGSLRPNTWTQLVVATAVAIVVASVLNYAIPRLYIHGAESHQTSRLRLRVSGFIPLEASRHLNAPPSTLAPPQEILAPSAAIPSSRPSPGRMMTAFARG